MIFGGLEKCTLIDYPGKTACMVYTIGCNFRCPYCHNPELVDETSPQAITEEEVLMFLDTRKGLLDGLVITGGEPTIHDDLLSFISKVKEKGFLVKLDSNGTRPAMLREAMERNLVDYVAMDIKSPLAKYSGIAARPVDVGAVQESIGLLMSSPVEYEFRTTVVKALLSEEDIVQIGREIQGAKRYYLQAFVPTKILNPQFKKKVSYSKEELEELCDKIKPYVTHCATR
jgi:pyruvate formate lyase activating enzyme